MASNGQEKASSATTGDTSPVAANAAASSNSSQSPGTPTPQPSTFNSQPPPPIPDHELLRRIGAGSYGEVWLARNVLGQHRAVKVVSRASFEQDKPYEREFAGIQKFEPISRAHEGHVDILHVGRNDAEGYFYYVMELADDENAERETQSAESVVPAAPDSVPRSAFRAPHSYHPRTLKSEIKRRGPLPVDDCVSIGLALARALAHLHECKLVHRDIKPSNIIFVGGAPKLADIGLVTGIDATRSFVGTDGYIPPEGPGTPQADLFSLGKVLYEMSTGQDRQDFPELPAAWRASAERERLLEFNEVILKACDDDVRQRYSTAQQLETDLALLQRGQSVQRKRAVQRRFALARTIALAAAAVATLVATGTWLFSTRFNPSTAPTPAELTSLAVLPFVNESKSSAHAYLSDALTDETMNALTNCAGLRVAPRSAVFAFKRATNDVRQIGEQLGVRTVLAGTFLRTSNGMHVTARLLNTPDGTQSWTANFERGREELGALGADVVLHVVRQMNLSLEQRALRRLETNLVRKMEAYDLCGRGQAQIDRQTRMGFTEGVNLLHQALALDPNCTRAHLILADAYLSASGWYLPPKQAMPTAKQSAMRAREIDDTLADAHASLGAVKMFYDWDWKGAEDEFKRAIELEPGSANAHGYYAFCLRAQGRLVESRAEQMVAQQLTPDSLRGGFDAACQFMAERQYSNAIEHCLKLLERDPNFILLLMPLAISYEQIKRYPEALAQLQRMNSIEKGPDITALLGHLHAVMGDRDKALKSLEQLEALGEQSYVSPTFKALIYAGLGDTNRALEFLEKGWAYHAPNLINLKIDPQWDALRAEPRFQALLKKIGLEN